MTTIPSIVSPELKRARRQVRVAMPDPTRRLEQDEEWFLYHDGSAWRELRLHDYAEIFAVPGLYEHVVTDILGCSSPEVVADLLVRAVVEAGEDPGEMTVLDLGAGNGCVAEQLAMRRFSTLVGVDLTPAAAEAAERDRPGLYADYAVGDLTDLPARERARLDARTFDAMVCVAALGFGDIPTEAFLAAFERVRPGGWVAFNIKESFLDPADESGFGSALRGMIGERSLEVIGQKQYRHRLSSSGLPLRYVAFIGRKRS
jgi:hypothetical protein